MMQMLSATGNRNVVSNEAFNRTDLLSTLIFKYGVVRISQLTESKLEIDDQNISDILYSQGICK